jgi:hypothetical protein
MAEYYGDLSKKRGAPVLWLNSFRKEKAKNESEENWKKKMIVKFKSLPQPTKNSFWREQIRFNFLKKSTKKRCGVTPNWIAMNCDKGLSLQVKKQYQEYKKLKNGKCLGPRWLKAIKCGRVGIRKAEQLNKINTKERKKREYLIAQSKRLDNRKKGLTYNETYPRSMKIIRENKKKQIPNHPKNLLDVSLNGVPLFALPPKGQKWTKAFTFELERLLLTVPMGPKYFFNFIDKYLQNTKEQASKEVKKLLIDVKELIKLHKGTRDVFNDLNLVELSPELKVHLMKQIVDYIQIGYLVDKKNNNNQLFSELAAYLRENFFVSRKKRPTYDPID